MNSFACVEVTAKRAGGVLCGGGGGRLISSYMVNLTNEFRAILVFLKRSHFVVLGKITLRSCSACVGRKVRPRRPFQVYLL